MLTSSAARLEELLAVGHWVVLTGAGVSTDSGVPGYRDERGVWLGASPMQFAEFVASDAARRRYWARSFVGYERMHKAEPNAAHHALVALEHSRLLKLLVTQNVDGLHQKAGSRCVLELHGRLGQAVCLSCGQSVERDALQAELRALNPDWTPQSLVLRPDGDAELDAQSVVDFRVPHCVACGGVLKPDVVFFGERVPASRHQAINEAIQCSNGLLVIGSSLVVNSGYRVVRSAEQVGVPVVVLNRGATRADEKATLKINENAGEVLSALVAKLAVASESRVGPFTQEKPALEERDIVNPN